MIKISYYTEEVLAKAQADINVIEEFLSIVPTIEDGLKKFNGKVINRRLLTQMEKAGIKHLGLENNRLKYYPENRYINTPNFHTVYSEYYPAFNLLVDQDNRLDFDSTKENLKIYVENLESQLNKHKEINQDFINQMDKEFEEVYQRVKELNDKYSDYGIRNSYILISNH